MAITHVGTEFFHNTAGSNNSGNHSVDVPSGTQNGDLMFLCTYGSTASITVNEAGWTNLFQQTHSAGGRSGRLDVYYRVASSEPSSYSISSSNNTRGTSISVFRGVEASDLINDWAVSLYTGAAEYTAPSVTTDTADCQVFTVIQDSSDDTVELQHSTDSVGVSELADFGADNGTNARTLALYLGPAQSSGVVSGIDINSVGIETYAIIASIAMTPGDNWSVDVSDTLTLNDYPTGVTHDVSHVLNVSDTLTLNDTPSSQRVTRTGLITDNLRLSDSASTQLTTGQNYQEDFSDTETLDDSVSRVHSAARPQSDTVTLSDTTTRTYSGSRSFDDTVTLSDTVSTSQAHSLTVSDELTLSDTTATAQDYVLTFVSDSILIGVTTADYSKGYGATAHDTETLSDSASTGEFDGNHERNANDVVELSDSISSTGAFVRDFSDSVDLSDTDDELLATVEGHEDILGLSDSVSFTLTLAVQDEETLSDTTSQASAIIRSLSDDETLSDTATSVSDYQRDFSDDETLSDEATAETGVLNLTDVLTLSDSISITHVAPDVSDEVGNYATTLVQGPATLYIGDFGATEPQGIEILFEPNEEWTDLGGTLDGVEVSVVQEYEEAEFVQVPDMPMRRLKKRSLSAKTVLAEPTLQNILYGLNGGTLASGSGYESYVPEMDVDEGTELTYRAVMLYGWAPGAGQNDRGKRRVVIMRKCLSIDNVEMAYKKEDQTGLSVTWGVHRVDDVTPPFLIIDED